MYLRPMHKEGDVLFNYAACCTASRCGCAGETASGRLEQGHLSGQAHITGYYQCWHKLSTGLVKPGLYGTALEYLSKQQASASRGQTDVIQVA